MSRPRLAVLASGSGSNFQAIAEAISAGQIEAELVLLFADHQDAFALTRAKKLGVPAFAAELQDFANKTAYEAHLLELLQAHSVDLIALAGYMRIMGAKLLQAFAGQIVNIHPSLLPAFPGRQGIRDAFDARVSVTGVTVHYVDEGIDTGPIIAQREVLVLPDDTVDSLAERIHVVEHELYPEVLAQLAKELGQKRKHDCNAATGE